MKNDDKVNLLIVDDTPANIFALQEILTHPRRNLISAASGKEALKIVLDKEIDLIILDVQMPEMDGFEVAQIIKSSARTKDIPIIFASAEKKEHQFVMKGFEEGAIDYLYKPLNAEVLEAKVSILLQLHLQKKELQEKNRLLEKDALLINNSADIICIINPSTLKFEEVNKAAVSILGYSLDEMKGSSLLLYISEEDIPLVKKLSTSDAEKITFETQVYTKDRNLKWLQWKIISKKGLWFANARDVTEIKEVEQIRNYLATVVKQSGDAIYLHDEEGQIISWNTGAESIYGFSETEALDMRIWNVVPNHLMAEKQEVINQVLQGEKIELLETKRTTKFGKIIDVLFSASVIKDNQDNIVSIAITERDITEKKKYEEQLKQQAEELMSQAEQLERSMEKVSEANKELESFSYSVSHDLRAPLRSINGFADMVVKSYSDKLDEEGVRMLNIIKDSAIKMGDLIDDLLEFSRMSRIELVKKEIAFGELAETVAEELTQTEPEKKKYITIKELPSAYGDKAMLKQVLTNLVSNAIKYSGKVEKPEIEIGALNEDNRTVFYVKDNGAGFDMEYAQKLFGVFQRLHSTKDFEGTGVGLALSHRIISRHGGEIWAKAEVDKGATFYFTLPNS